MSGVQFSSFFCHIYIYRGNLYHQSGVYSLDTAARIVTQPSVPTNSLVLLGVFFVHMIRLRESRFQEKKTRASSICDCVYDWLV